MNRRRPIGVASRLDNLGELVAVVTLDHIALHVQQSTEQPLHYYVPLVASQDSASSGSVTADGSIAARRLTPLSPSVLPQLYTAFEGRVGAVQVDNHLEEAELPVVLFSFRARDSDRRSSGGSGAKETTPQQAAQFIFVSSVPLLASSPPDRPAARDVSAPLLSSSSLFRRPDLHVLSVHLSPFVVNAEDQFAFRLLSVGLECSRQIGAQVAKFKGRSSDSSSPSSTSRSFNSDALPSSSSSSRRAEIKSSLHLSDEALDRLEGVGAPRLFVHYAYVSALDFRVTARASSGVVPVFLGAEQMPVSLGSVSLRCVYCPLERLMRELASMYLASALARSPLLLGSLDLLGNPTFLLQSVGAGVRDLLMLPRNALGQGPRAFIGAVGGGLMSLLRHTTEGTLTSVSGFSTSVARNMERLAGATDEATTATTRTTPTSRSGGPSSPSRAARRPRARPSGLGGGLFSGVKSLGAGVVGGLVGVVSHPLAGASHGGLTGFMRGVGVGLVGAVSKPLGGVAELVSATSQGLASSSGVEMPHTQRFVRRDDMTPATSTLQQPRQLLLRFPERHPFHRFSAAKLRQIVGGAERYVDHAVVAFAPLPAPSSPTTMAATAHGAPPPPPSYDASAPKALDGSAAAASSSSRRPGSFVLLLLTNVGVRLVGQGEGDLITHAFAWSDVRIECIRSRNGQATPLLLGGANEELAPVSTLELAATFFDQRQLQEWMQQQAAAQETTKHLPFDILVLHPRDAAAFALWLPRVRRTEILPVCHRLQTQH
jgi:hypothetical protein